MIIEFETLDENCDVHELLCKAIFENNLDALDELKSQMLNILYVSKI